MSEALFASNAVLWIVVVAMGLVIAALARQVGVLHERIAPAGALAVQGGVQVGESAPEVTAPALSGATLVLGAERDDGRATLLFFLSPTCPVCKQLLPALRSLARHESARLDVVLASDGGSSDEHRRFVADEKLESLPYVVSSHVGLAYGVSQLPFAAVIDAEGVLRARGLVNTREHLESLLEAMDLGVGSIQEYLAREGGA